MKIFIEESALPFALSQEVIAKFPYEVIPSSEKFKWELLPEEELISVGKKRLFLVNFKGEFLKPCPGTKNYLCCGYRIFHIGEGCPLDCSYCILQLYLNRPGLKIWANLLEDGFTKLINFLEESKKRKSVTRLGTGEFTDSLALEAITGISEKLINLWLKYDPYGVLELKTKVFLPEVFYQKTKGTPKVIFAWSVNTEKIISEEEKGTASLEARLKSALLAVKHGFSVAFHFDPMIYYEGAEEDYPRVLEKILNLLPLEKIAWISLGTLRFPKPLKDIAQRRFPESKIYSFEFVEGLDLKLRYFIEIRKKLYRAMAKLIKSTKKEVTYYFCMESERIWREVLDANFHDSAELKDLLDRTAKKLCSL